MEENRSIVVYRSKGEQLWNEFIWSDAGAQFLLIVGVGILLFLGGLWLHESRKKRGLKFWD